MYLTPDYQSNSGSHNIITYAGNTGQYHVIHWMAFSYSAAPTGGRLFIENSGSVVFDVDVTTGGPGPITFEPPIIGSNGGEVRVGMAAGGTGIVSKLTVGHSTR